MSRSHAVDEKQAFQESIQRNPPEENVGEELHQAEDSINNPVRQPLCVVALVRRFNRFHTEIENF